MSPINPSLLAKRRSMAVGAWSLLVMPMALISSNVSVALSVIVLLTVSIASSVALLLISGNWLVERNSNRRQQYAVGAVSFVIPLGWAFLLGGRSSPLVTLAFVAIAVIPMTVVWLTLMSREPLVSRPSQTDTTSGRTAIESIPFAASSIETRNLHISANDEASEGEIGHAQTDESSIDLEEPAPSDVTQWLTRSLMGESEIIEGGIRIDFANGQRDATVHVSFCPPFQTIPAVTTEDLDGADLEIRVAATFAFGARLTVRRPSSERATQAVAETCRIGFVAIAAPIRKAA